MKMTKNALTIMGIALILPVAVLAFEGPRNYQIHNRLRLEYDDNIYESGRDETSSFKVIEEIEFLVNLNLENTFASIRYKPSFVWWENRSEDSTDFHHDVDLIFNQRFTPRVSLDVKNTFRYAQQPNVIESGAVVRERSDFLYNALVGTVLYRVSPVGRLEVSGRYNLLRYDESRVADVEDYDMYVAGLTYRHTLVPETALKADVRFETIDYDQIDRGSDAYQIGFGVEHMFSPNLLGNLRAGYMAKDYNDETVSSDSAPYFDGNLTFVPSPDTRVTLGMGYSMLESDIFPYANQERFRVFGGVAHDVTPRLSVNLIGSFARSNYDAADIVPSGIIERFEVPEELLADFLAQVDDGKEEFIQLSARVTYRVNRSNWLEAGWQFTDLSSDLRENLDRNRINIGWKTPL